MTTNIPCSYRLISLPLRLFLEVIISCRSISATYIQQSVIPPIRRAYIYIFPHKMSLKIDSIPILAGSSNYAEREQQIKRFLQSEDLYSHIEGDEVNPNAPWPASFPPVLPDNPSAAR